MPDAELLDELQARRAIKMPAFEARRGDDDVVELGEGGLEVRRIGIAVARPENPAVRQIAAEQVVYVIARLGEVADGDRFRGAGPAHDGPPSTPSAAPSDDSVHQCAASGGRICVSLPERSEAHTSELQSLMRISYAVFCLKHTKRIHLY